MPKRLLVGLVVCWKPQHIPHSTIHNPQPPPYLPSPFTSPHSFCLFSPPCTITHHYVYLASPFFVCIFSSFSLSAPHSTHLRFSSDLEPTKEVYSGSRRISKQRCKIKESKRKEKKRKKATSHHRKIMADS